MVDKFSDFVEKGFWWAVGLIGTISCGSITLWAKKDSETRKELAVLHKRVTNFELSVAQNYPSNADLKMMFDGLTQRLDSLQTDVREIRTNQKK